MPRGRNRLQRSAKTLKNNVWAIAFLDEQTVSSGSRIGVPMVVDGDWALGGQRATLLTVRGWLSVNGSPQLTAMLEGTIAWYIGLVDEDITVFPSLILPSTYVDEVILTTGGHSFEQVAANVRRPTKDWDINVKTKRTFNTGTNVMLVLLNSTADDITISLLTRTLLRKGGN